MRRGCLANVFLPSPLLPSFSINSECIGGELGNCTALWILAEGSQGTPSSFVMWPGCFLAGNLHLADICNAENVSIVFRLGTHVDKKLS